jgi:hypothetical protein
MRRTRWKLAAGSLALSLGGLAAVADVPSRAGIVSCVGAPLVQDPAPPVPAVPVVPPIGQPTTPAPLLPPPVPAGNVGTPADLPMIPPAPAPLVLVTATETAPMPRAAYVQVSEIPSVVVADTRPVVPPIPSPQPEPIVPTPIAGSLPPPVSPPQVAADTLPPALPRDLPQGAQSPLPSAEKKLKVLLHLGDERPRFEVRDGDEVYLKVICDRVDVKSPSDRGETMSVLKATGTVTFVTPGGEGMCSELCVVPGTGQVIVAGQVAFKYSWGKAETTVSGDRMTFRLGAAPGAPPATVPASFQQRR